MVGVAALNLPAIYGYGHPPGAAPEVLVSPNAMQLAFESRFWYLFLVPLGLAVGAVFVLKGGSMIRRRKLALAGAAMMLIAVPSFGFGIDAGNSSVLYLGGELVTVVSSAAPGANSLLIAALFFLGSLGIILMRD